MRELELSRAAVARETEGQRDNYMSPETRGRITTHDGFVDAGPGFSTFGVLC